MVLEALEAGLEGGGSPREEPPPPAIKIPRESHYTAIIRAEIASGGEI